MSRRVTIHTAIAVGRRGGTHYRCRAIVREATSEEFIDHSMTVAIDDCPVEAQREAVRHIFDMYRRDGIAMPEHTIHHHGKMAAAMVDGYLFLRR